MPELRKTLDDFTNVSESIWNDYLLDGPGKLQTERLTDFAEALSSVHTDLDADDVPLPRDDWQDEFDSVVAELQPLLQRCVERSEGLSFVTGEAGLIPRHDLHERCELSLDALRQLADELGEETN